MYIDTTITHIYRLPYVQSGKKKFIKIGWKTKKIYKFKVFGTNIFELDRLVLEVELFIFGHHFGDRSHHFGDQGYFN